MNAGLHRPRFYYGWLIVVLAFVSLGFAYGIWYSFGVFFVAVLRDFGWSRADTALASSVFVMVHGLASPVLGVFIDRIGIRPVATVGALFLAISLAACSLVTEPWQYYLTYGVMTAIGVNAAGVLPNYVAVNRWFVKRRGLVMGIASSGIGLLGLSVLVPLNQYMISTLGWRGTYVALALAFGLVLPALAFFLQRERPQDMGLLPDGEPMAPVLNQDRGTPDRPAAVQDWTPRSALRAVPFWGLEIGYFMSAIAQQTILVHIVAYLTDLGRDPLLGATLIGVIGMVSIPAKVIWGIASDRLGREGVYTAGMGCILVAIALLFALPGLADDWPPYLFALFFGLGYGMHTTLTPAIAGDLFSGKHFAVIYSYVLIAGAAGAAIGPFVAGYLFDLGGSYAPAFLICALATVSAAAAVWIAAPRRARAVAMRSTLAAK